MYNLSEFSDEINPDFTPFLRTTKYVVVTYTSTNQVLIVHLTFFSLLSNHKLHHEADCNLMYTAFLFSH